MNSNQRIVRKTQILLDFAKFRIDLKTLSKEEQVQLQVAKLPLESEPCRYYPNKPVKGSAFSAINENALCGGYFRTDKGEVKVLVVLTDRPQYRDQHDFVTADLCHVKLPAVKKPKVAAC